MIAAVAQVDHWGFDGDIRQCLDNDFALIDLDVDQVRTARIADFDLTCTVIQIDDQPAGTFKDLGLGGRL